MSACRETAAARGLLVAALVLAAGAMAQPVPPAQPIQGGPAYRPDLGGGPVPRTPPWLKGEQAEAFQRDLAAYDRCTKDRAGEMRLAESAGTVIQLRDQRSQWERLLQENANRKNPNAMLPPPGSYEKMLAQNFAEYRALGGTAATVDAVRPLAAPCKNPWAALAREPGPVKDSRSMPLPLK